MSWGRPRIHQRDCTLSRLGMAAFPTTSAGRRSSGLLCLNHILVKWQKMDDHNYFPTCQLHLKLLQFPIIFRLAPSKLNIYVTDVDDWQEMEPSAS